MVLRDFRVPTETIEPDGPFTAEVDIANGANIVDPFDPDSLGSNSNQCNADLLKGAGYCFRIELERPDGSVVDSGPQAIGTTEIGTANVTVEFNLTAPSSEGQKGYRARLVMDGSGKQTDWLPNEITVNEKEATQPDDGSGGGGGGGDNDRGQNGQKDLLKLAVENPVGSLVVLAGAGVALQSAFGGE